MRKRYMAQVISCLIVAVVLGCGSKVSQDQPLDQVKADAQQSTVDQLSAKVDAYKAEIAKYETLLSELRAKLAALKPADLLGEEAKKLNADVADVVASVKKLQERLQVYVGELAKKKEAVTKS